MEAPVDWLPPILMLAAGLVIGVIAAVIVARRSRGLPDKSNAGSQPLEEESDLQLELRDLEAKKEDLLAQLREMEDTAAKREPEQLAVERYEVELRTAEVLREIDRLTGEVTAPRARDAKAKGTGEGVLELEAAPPSPIKGFVWGVASAAAIGALVVFVGQSASNRAEGGSVTGGPQMSGQPSAQTDPELDRAIAAVNAQPDNIDARVDLAYAYIVRENFMQVFEQTQMVLQQNPDEPRALTYQALVRLMMGQNDVSTQMLERAVEVDPDFLDSRVYLAITYSQSGRFDEAMAQIDEAKRRNPNEASRLDEVVAELEMRKAGGGAGPPTDPKTDPHAGMIPAPPAPGTGAAQPPAAATGAPGSVSGTISLAEGVAVNPGAPIYVIVRAVGEGGPPVAVARLTAGRFPAPFSLSKANSMMGDDLPGQMRIEVRVDLDGNAMTRDEGAPEGVAENVASGKSGIVIVLR